MAETWPLPYEVLQNGFSQNASDNTIRTKMEAGLDKIRKRYTSQIRNLNVQMQITHAQYITLETFYNTTLQFGVNRFNYPDPIYQKDDDPDMYEHRFLSTPTYTPLGGLYYIVSMEWERLT